MKDTCYYPKRGESINRIKKSRLGFFGDIDMNEFNTDRLKEYLIQSGEHLKPTSLGHSVRCIKSLFRWSHEEGYILKNPAAKLKELKLGKRNLSFS